MTEYRKIFEPALVRHVSKRSQQQGFTSSCSPETGQLLAALVTSTQNGRILELGTGAAYGTAWMVSALRAGTTLLSVDIDPGLVRRAAEMFREHPSVSVQHSPWEEALDGSPYDLIFVDVSEAKTDGIDRIVDALRPGGIAVLDDLTPIELWPAEWRGKPDPVRDSWLNHPALVSTEVRVAADHAAVIAVRR